ncbi:MAG: quinoprotein dehydrogenase-associated putative ABC transporter substrate-binding protein [Myxococcales bacterium]|nr:quinoprotein dehydrogenase-associated putative ABC transporter substrate-binding protein [Myxococcales bacterium]
MGLLLALVLRVCADPNNMPFSNRAGEGIENALARIVAGELHAKLEYYWAPIRRGYVRNTLNADKCDAMMEVPAEFARTAATRPWYTSSYVFVTRPGTSVGSFDDPALRKLRIGVQVIGNDYSNTPPAHALGVRGIVGNVVGFPVYGDQGKPDPEAAIIDAVARSDIDVAVAWGPLAGWFAARAGLQVVPVSPDRQGPFRFSFPMAIGVKRGNEQLRRALDAAIERKRPEIDALLARYHVPSHRVYVSDEGSDDVSVLENDVVVARIPVGKRPRGLKLAPDGKLYVAVSGSPRAGPGVRDEDLPPPDRGQDGIAVVDLGHANAVTRLPGGPDPESFDLSRDGRLLFVSNEDASALSVVEIATARVLASVKVGAQPEGVTVSPDGKLVYVTSEEDGEIDVVDASRFTLLARPQVAPRPRAVAFTPDGARAFVTAEQGAAVDVIDARRHQRVGRIAVAGKPMGLAMSRDGSRVWVSTGRGGSVAVIDAATDRVLRTFEKVGARPWGLGLSPQGDRLYSANGPSDDVSVIDAESGRILQRVPVGKSPWGIAVSRY